MHGCDANAGLTAQDERDPLARRPLPPRRRFLPPRRLPCSGFWCLYGCLCLCGGVLRASAAAVAGDEGLAAAGAAVSVSLRTRGLKLCFCGAGQGQGYPANSSSYRWTMDAPQSLPSLGAACSNAISAQA